MCSETSPRISFSNDLSQEDDTQSRQEPRRDMDLMESSSDFEFSFCRSLDHEPSLADDLFADGMILPAQTQEKTTKKVVSLPPLPSYSNSDQNSKKESMIRELMVLNSHVEEKHHPKSFWGFKRSSSLNCDIKKSLICSLPLLSRSNSTGSVPANLKKTTMKDVHKHSNHQKQKQQSSNFMVKSSSSASSTYVYSMPHKPPLKKNYGNGVRISPILNVPVPCIVRGTANLFGLGSFLRNNNGKEKKTNKK